MVVIVIVGILAAIAAPSYRGYVIKTKLAEGYVVFDAIKKGEIVYHASHGVFAEGTMSSNFTVDDDHVLVMNGGKYTPSSTSELLTLIGPVVPPDQPLGVWAKVLVGGYNETTEEVLADSEGSKIGNGGTGSQCYDNPDYLELTPTDFGIIPYSGDNSYDWFVISGVFGLSYPGSDNCVYQVQTTQTWGDGMQTSGITELK